MRRAKGISFDEWVGEVLIARAASTQSSVPNPRRSRLWELRKDLSLGDISIRDLIREGRE